TSAPPNRLLIPLARLETERQHERERATRYYTIVPPARAYRTGRAKSPPESETITYRELADRAPPPANSVVVVDLRVICVFCCGCAPAPAYPAGGPYGEPA